MQGPGAPVSGVLVNREKGNDMSIKLKALGLGLLALLAMGAFAVVNASAVTTGHFTSDVAHTEIRGSEKEGTGHTLKFQRTQPTNTPTGSPIVCTEAKYTGTIASATTQVVQVTPEYTGCRTEGDPHGSVSVHHNGCTYTFRSRTTGHGTVAVDCPANKAIEITHPNCGIKVPAQDPATNANVMKGGVAYTTTTDNEGKHAITLDVTITHITGHFESGACIFLGTTKEFDMTGSVTVAGFDTVGNPVGITAQ